MRQRTKWLDVLRCFGIFLIYIGHFATYAGNAYGYVFTHHVALFFFAAGCAENFHANRKLLTTIKKTVFDLILPWAFFAVLSLVVFTIEKNASAKIVYEYFLIVINGTIRNQFVAASLWFLTCMAVVRIMFAVIRKVRFKWLIFAICVALFCYVELKMVPHPTYKPAMFFNFDSAIYYIVYYAIGYVSFPFINKLLEADAIWKKCVLTTSFLFSAGYATCIFFKKTIIRDFLYTIPVIEFFMPIINALVIIWMYCVLAKLLENIALFNKVGQDTLYLCGNEYIIKSIVSSILCAVGLGINMRTPLVVYIYCIMLIALATLFLSPIEKKCISYLKEWVERAIAVITDKLRLKRKPTKNIEQ